MGKSRNHYRYEFKQNRQVVYRGITRDPERSARSDEVRPAGDGPSFTLRTVSGCGTCAKHSLYP